MQRTRVFGTSIRCEGDQKVGPMVIFKAPTGARILAGTEPGEWDSRVAVMFASTGKMNTKLMVEQYVPHWMTGMAEEKSEQLLAMDRYKSHMMQEVIDDFHSANTTPFFTAGGCTDVGSPCDQVAKVFKDTIRNEHQKWWVDFCSDEHPTALSARICRCGLGYLQVKR